MSRPRKPFGANQPGRLPATMVKVLAAEMSDPQRSRKGKRYAADGSVTDITIEAGVVTAEVQGSRATPYIATLEVGPGDGMPLRRDLHATCTCPDDEHWNDRICKHVVALMYVFADELLIEPELLDVWRDNDRSDHAGGGRDDRDADPAGRLDGTDDPDENEDDDAEETDQESGRAPRRHLQLVRDGIDRARHERETGEPADEEPDAVLDPLVLVLGVPEGRTIPVVPVLEPADLALPRRPELATALREALHEVRVDWD
ncbi:MAG: SWIM zinc finger family protein [Actinomycetota bacterium]